MADIGVPTVKIKHPEGGYCHINARDFDSSVHEIFVETAEAALVAEVKPEAPEPAAAARRGPGRSRG